MKNTRLILPVILLVSFLLLFLFAPQLLIVKHGQMSAKDLTMLSMDARPFIAQIAGGIILLFGLYIIYRRIVGLENNMVVVQQAQINERLGRAIDQLGTYKIEVQLGGIFSLEKIAMESQRDHWMIMEILSAYVRENAKWNDKQTPTGTEHVSGANGNANDILRGAKAPTDIQAALTVLGRRKWVEMEFEEMKVLNLRHSNMAHTDLRRAYLKYTNFRGSSLERVNLAEAQLAGAFLGEVNLSGAILYKADLRGANLAGANLEGVNLKEADLVGANLQGARLKGASLSDARLEGANLSEVNLKGSNLCGVSLRNVNLANSILHYAQYDEDTLFPEWLSQEVKTQLKMSLYDNSPLIVGATERA